MQPLHQVCYWSSEGFKKYWAENTVGWEEWFDLDLWACDLKINRDHLLNVHNSCTKIFEHVTSKSIGAIYSFIQPLHQVWFLSNEGVKNYCADNTVGWEEWCDLDLWACDFKTNRDYLLIEGNPCTKFDQVKGSKDIERTTLCIQTDRPTDNTDWQLQNNMPPISRGE